MSEAREMSRSLNANFPETDLRRQLGEIVGIEEQQMAGRFGARQFLP